MSGAGSVQGPGQVTRCRFRGMQAIWDVGGASLETVPGSWARVRLVPWNPWINQTISVLHLTSFVALGLGRAGE